MYTVYMLLMKNTAILFKKSHDTFIYMYIKSLHEQRCFFPPYETGTNKKYLSQSQMLLIFPNFNIVIQG